ncbi:hypothetical protein XENOCAPTIV_008455, partial [Xenoophorus captivus]
TKTEEVVMVSNKYKQLYECRLPAQAVRFHQDPASEPDSQGYTGPDVPDLLRPMYKAPCLVKTKDWWTYEFCHGQHIRQYHLEGDVLFLGYYESEFDWNNETAKASKQHKLKRYHSQAYVNGSRMCDDLPVAAPFLFYLFPADTKRKVEQISEELKNLDEMLAGNQGADETVEVTAEETTPPPSSTQDGSNGKGRSVLSPLLIGPRSFFFPVCVVPRKLRGEEKDEDEQLLEEFEDEIADLSVPSEKIEEIKEEMQKEFDNIIDEAQQELETEGLKGEFDRTQATQALETTLDKLLDHLEEKDDQDPQQQKVQRPSDPSRGSPSLAPKQPGELSLLSLSCLVTSDKAAEDHVKIKITKYKTGSSPDGEVKVQEMGEGDPQWQHIKDVVKEQLEKAGLKAEGMKGQCGCTHGLISFPSPVFSFYYCKIEVKILTRKNAEEAGDQWLTEEDTKSFRELLINLLVI